VIRNTRTAVHEIRGVNGLSGPLDVGTPDQLPLGSFLTLGLGVACAILWLRRMIKHPIVVGDEEVSG
jgi:hypothetical protein